MRVLCIIRPASLDASLSVYDQTGDDMYTRGGGLYIGTISRNYREKHPPTQAELARLLPKGAEFVAYFGQDYCYSQEYGVSAELRQELEAGDVAPAMRAMFDAQDRATACRLAVAKQTSPLHAEWHGYKEAQR